MNKVFGGKNTSAYEAITEAQRIAFAPVVFQAARALRDLGVLAELDVAGVEGATVDSIAESLKLSQYGIRLLLESGLSIGVVSCVDEQRFAITKVGHYLLHDEMTRVNMDFNHFVCYLGMYDLGKAVAEGRPVGLRAIAENFSTIYEALPHLPKPIKSSWYAFDHFYSDTAYPAALDIVLAHRPTTLVDVGCNLARFSILAMQADSSLRVTMVDLADELAEAARVVEEAGFKDRVEAISMDVRDNTSHLPRNCDAYWMSQFLCCFDESEIVSLLQRASTVMSPESRLYILETCWDRQQHEAAAFSLVNTSPYFTCIANGNSKMYSSGDLLRCITEAGLHCLEITDGLGACHTLFECGKRVAPQSLTNRSESKTAER